MSIIQCLQRVIQDFYKIKVEYVNIFKPSEEHPITYPISNPPWPMACLIGRNQGLSDFVHGVKNF